MCLVGSLLLPVSRHSQEIQESKGRKTLSYHNRALCFLISVHQKCYLRMWQRFTCSLQGMWPEITIRQEWKDCNLTRNSHIIPQPWCHIASSCLTSSLSLAGCHWQFSCLCSSGRVLRHHLPELVSKSAPPPYVCTTHKLVPSPKSVSLHKLESTTSRYHLHKSVLPQFHPTPKSVCTISISQYRLVMTVLCCQLDHTWN